MRKKYISTNLPEMGEALKSPKKFMTNSMPEMKEVLGAPGKYLSSNTPDMKEALGSPLKFMTTTMPEMKDVLGTPQLRFSKDDLGEGLENLKGGIKGGLNNLVQVISVKERCPEDEG